MQRNFSETFMKYVFMVCALLSIVSIILIFYFIFKGGLPFILEEGVGNFVLGTSWKPTASNPQFGIFPMIMGSILVTFGAIIIGVPIGVLTAIFLAFFCPKFLYRWLKPAINLMAAIPSIVYGFFGLLILVPWSRDLMQTLHLTERGNTGMNVFTASLLLGIMILPTIIGLSEASLNAVPKSFYDASIGLGATHERSVMNVVVPAATSGIFSSIILGIGRAIGETMAVILVAGNQAMIPQALNHGTRTLTTNIVLEMAYAAGRHRESLIATSVVLFVFILIINSVFMVVKSKGDKY
ncbi:phosphate ABC transporter permease subunit PstC [Ignavigranum ruoffiae]|uniref:Phosphate transport system permease protein n=1 Tax=Ignavigranum ruoffiae TaxID=89093 RepID=A0A1H9DH77_9LACT|nr:phosphate ABC transporter permease subunit PstC [Ignavigranum ruoffiae]UPQ86275.1 phosphate ABC transporter permease subunit PstC [Ignavigranum ruoffiae]SEQ12834.1 phosphate ABC transporter membrane protein 1, PhoT family [Ignavigranum ruoffiae]